MNRRMLVLTLSCAVLLGWSGAAWAEGFGTPVVDGTLDAMYGAAEATDSNTDGNGNAVMDLVQLYVVNDNDYWYFFFTVDANIATTTWGKYRLYIDTTNDAAGATLDCWGRNVIVNDPHKPEFSVGSWMDNLPYGPEDTQFWAWNQGTTSWTQQGTVAAAARVGATVSGVEWKIAKTALGDPAQIWCEVWSTGGGASDNAQDTCNDPAEDWNATDWSTQAQLKVSTSYPLAAVPDAGVPDAVSPDQLTKPADSKPPGDSKLKVDGKSPDAPAQADAGGGDGPVSDAGADALVTDGAIADQPGGDGGPIDQDEGCGCALEDPRGGGLLWPLALILALLLRRRSRADRAG